MPYNRRIWGILGVTFCLLAFFIGFPIIAEHQVINKLESLLKRKVLLEDVDINLFTLEVCIKKLKIQEPKSETNFIAFEEFYINASWISLFRLGIFVDQIRLIKPYFYAALLSDSNFNFSDLISQSENKNNLTKSKPLALDQLPISFDLKNIEIKSGTFVFVDHIHGITHNLKQFNFKLPKITNISNTSENQTDISLNFIINKLRTNAEIQARIFQKIPSAKINLINKGGNFSFYQPYLNSILNWELCSGQLDSELKIDAKIIKNKPDIMIQGRVKIVNFEIKENSRQPLISFPLLEIQIDKTLPIESKINLSLVKLLQPAIKIQRKKDKSLNLIPVFKKSQKSKSSNASNLKPLPKKISKKSKLQDNKTSNLIIQLKEVMIEKGDIHIIDASLPEPFETKLQNLQFKSNGINLSEKIVSSIELKTDINPNGKVVLKGALDLEPLQWDGSIFIEDLDISMIHPFLNDFLNGRLENGRLFMNLDTFFEQKKDNPHVNLSGNLSLNHFIFREPLNMDESLTWDQFEFKKINFGIFPHYLEIDKINLKHLNVPVFINTKGKINWLALMKNQSTTKTQLDKKKMQESSPISELSVSAKNYSSVSSEKISDSPLQRLKINKIVMDDNNIHFLDMSIKQSFKAQMTQINGLISGLDQNAEQPINITLNGKLNDISPLKLSGNIMPFNKPLSFKLKISLFGIEIPPFTPYTNKYIGYKMDKGQLNLNLDYQVERNHLISKNDVLINQLDLGEKDKQADVPHLPLEFALALLKDREGNIQLNIPIEGNLDSLNISFKKIIMQTLKNLMEKAVTAPFSFLSQLYPNAADIRSMTFDYGKYNLSKSTINKLKQVADLLINRPLLKLQLNYYLNEKEEINALKKIQLQKKLQFLKYKDQNPKSTSKKNIQNITLNDEEYGQYLIEFYQEQFDKLPPFEMLNKHSLEKELLSSIDINSEYLENLGLERITKVKKMLVDKYKIQPNRIFIQKNKYPAKKLGNVKQSQVLLTLQ